jgi:uncharacterized protein (TIGR00251 family)
MGNLTVRETNGGVVFAVKVAPGSSRTALAGLLDGALKVKVAAPAEKGKANRRLLEFLAEQLGVKKNALAIISGQTGTFKNIRFEGTDSGTLMKKLRLTS